MTYAPDKNVRYIVVHYSATPVERDVSIEDIDQMHKERGFRKVGYHFFIRKNGQIEFGRDTSEPGRFETGAHSKGENHESIGICYEGGVYAHDLRTGEDTRTALQIEALIFLIDKLLERFPKAEVVGHRDMPGAKTQCPGFDVKPWWASVVAARAPKQSLIERIIAAILALFGKRKTA